MISLADKLILCEKLKEDIQQTISEDPPSMISKGNVIRDGCHAELDDLRNVIRNSKELLLEIQAKEIEKEQIVSSYRIGRVEQTIPTEKFRNGNQHYKETYGGKK